MIPGVAGPMVPSIPSILNTLSNALSGNVTLNNTGTFFDGPAVAQGSSGTWFVSGTVSLEDTGAAANIAVKLWDGTTVIASAVVTIPAASEVEVVALCGVITNPAGNLKISAKDVTATTGLIVANASGAAADSTITAIRIA